VAKKTVKRIKKTPTKSPPKARAAPRKSKPPAPRPAAPKSKTGAAAARVKKSAEPVDLSAFPRESIRQFDRWICLACVADVFTRRLGLAQKTAEAEIKRYTPSLDELRADPAPRPFFAEATANNRCPYCEAAAKWHARLTVYRIESGKATDALRRELIRSLPTSAGRFVVLEEKATQQHAFFEWLEATSAHLDFDDRAWLIEASIRYLGRKEPKVDWHAEFQNVGSIRRSRFLEEGWEIDSGRLFLAPVMFDELLLVQYLLSRSHKAGGLTLEGRYTLAELYWRLRNAGYLRAVGVAAQNPSDALEKLLEHLSGGETAVKFYHIVDRRDFLEKLNLLKSQKPPRPRLAASRG
jgi:hypothetical protein